jgi:Domain of unknown function (DUF4232)
VTPPAPYPAPLCSAAQLTFTGYEAVGAGGTDGAVVELRNTGHACLADGFPRVELLVAHRGWVPIAHAGWPEPSGDVAPGQRAAFNILGSANCSTEPNPPQAARFTAALPGGGTITESLPQGSAAGAATVSTACGNYVTPLFPFPAPQGSQLPADPFAALVASISAPLAVEDGAPITYVVHLLNPTGAAVTLSPCRGYEEGLGVSVSLTVAYELNCAAAHAIPAHGVETFVMELPTYSAPPAEYSLCWQLDLGPPAAQAVCAEVLLRS